MRAPKPDKEDPAVVAAREREERRAESMRTSETQALLAGATARRTRRNGVAGGAGAVPLIAPTDNGGSSSGRSNSRAVRDFGGMGENQIALY